MSRARELLGHLKRSAEAVRDMFSVERQMSLEAQAGHQEWLAETEPVREGFMDDIRGRDDR